MGCSHSSVDSSAPTLLPPQVRVSRTPTTLLSLIVKFLLYFTSEKNKNKQKVAGVGSIYKNNT